MDSLVGDYIIIDGSDLTSVDNGVYMATYKLNIDKTILASGNVDKDGNIGDAVILYAKADVYENNDNSLSESENVKNNRASVVLTRSRTDNPSINFEAITESYSEESNIVSLSVSGTNWVHKPESIMAHLELDGVQVGKSVNITDITYDEYTQSFVGVLEYDLGKISVNNYLVVLESEMIIDPTMDPIAVSGSSSLTINTIDNSITKFTCEDYEYSDHTMPVVEAINGNDSVVFEYILKDSYKEETIDDDWTSGMPTELGEYYLRAIIEASTNYNRIVSSMIEITISEKIVYTPVIDDKLYNGVSQSADINDSNIYTVTINDGGKDVGKYSVILTLIDGVNYNWHDSNEITLEIEWEIEKIELVITANDMTITYGDNLINNGVTYVGFVNEEISDVLNGELIYKYNYEVSNNPGYYEISVSGLTSDNYEINYVKGRLTVLQNTLTTLSDISISLSNGISPDFVLNVVTLNLEDFKNVKISKDILGFKGKIIQAYDITITNDGVVVNADNTYTIRLLIGEDYLKVKKLGVVYIDDDGNIVNCEATRDGDYMVFTVNHLSTYALVRNSSSVIIVIILILCGIMILFGLFILGGKLLEKYYHKDNKILKKWIEWANICNDALIVAYEYFIKGMKFLGYWIWFGLKWFYQNVLKKSWQFLKKLFMKKNAEE